MTYTKPEVAVLGNADTVIEHVGKIGGNPDSPLPNVTPAYDLDE